MSLAGFLLRDNRADTPLPDRELPASASLVLAAPRAVMPASPLAPAHLHTLSRAIGNGLGNASDRLALIAPDGVLVDTLS